MDRWKNKIGRCFQCTDKQIYSCSYIGDRRDKFKGCHNFIIARLIFMFFE